jgi:hypothetical protein
MCILVPSKTTVPSFNSFISFRDPKHLYEQGFNLLEEPLAERP